MTDKLKFKFNGGRGAVLCSNCAKIIMSGNEIPEYIWETVKPGSTHFLGPMFCSKQCEEEYKKKREGYDNKNNSNK